MNTTGANHMNKSGRARALAVLGLLALGACNLDFTDPNLPSESEVIEAARTLGQVAVGLQAQYSDQLVDAVYVNGLVTNEIGAGSASFDAYQRADRGEPLTG